MKKIVVLALIMAGSVGIYLGWKQINKIPIQKTETTQEKDIAVIRNFMGKPDLDLAFIGTDLPMPYFGVGKVTKVGNGENMEAVEGWVRQVNIYDEKMPLNGGCYVYEYHLDARNHMLTYVSVKGLHPDEITTLKNKGVTCVEHPPIKNITKAEAEPLAMSYLRGAIPNFEQIKDQFVFSTRSNGESYEWAWQDKDYKLPEGLSSRPFPGPIILMSVYGNSEIRYWNTTSLFKN